MDAKRRSIIRRKIKDMTLMDDRFMSVCLRDNIECVQLILRIIMKKDDLIVTNVHTQDLYKNLRGRSVTLDVVATDSSGKVYDIEIQRDDRGAGRKRSRYHLGMIDSDSLDFGQPFDALPETWIIFITEGDPLERGLPIYHVERIIVETGEPFNDDEHVIYVNGSCVNSKDDLGKLMGDLSNKDPNKMNFKPIADAVRRHKDENEEGEDTVTEFSDWLDGMLEEMKSEMREELKEEMTEQVKEEITAQVKEEGRAEGRAEERKIAEKEARKNLKKVREEMAQKLLKVGLLSIEDIADAAGLTVKNVQKLAAQKAA